MLSGEEPWESNKKMKTILDLIYFNLNNIPYLITPFFPISQNITNAEMRVLLRNCLERNQLKRIYLGLMEENIISIFRKQLFQDCNFDIYDKLKISKSNRFYYIIDLLIFKNIYHFCIQAISELNNKIRETNQHE